MSGSEPNSRGTPPGRWDQMAARYDFGAELATEQRRHRDQLEGIFLKLLGVMDAVERLVGGTETGPSATVPAHSLESLGKELAGVLAAAGVRPMERIGQVVDPERDEVVDMRETNAVPDGSVVDVLIQGYQWDGATLRRSRVVVAKHSDNQS